MFDEKDMQEMFRQGMYWERRKIQPCSYIEAMESAIRKIRDAEQRVKRQTVAGSEATKQHENDAI